MNKYLIAASSAKERHNNDVSLQAISQGLRTRIIQDPSVSDLAPDTTLVTYGVSCPHNRALIRQHISRGGVWMPIDPAWLGETEGVVRFTLGGFRPVYQTNVLPLAEPSQPYVIDPDRFRTAREGYYLVLPPTTTVADFFNFDKKYWIDEIKKSLGSSLSVVREHPLEATETLHDLQKQLDGACAVIGFNSAIMLREVLEQGIPVAADPRGSILGNDGDFPPARPRVISADRANAMRAYLELCQGTHEQLAQDGFVVERLAVQRAMLTANNNQNTQRFSSR